MPVDLHRLAKLRSLELHRAVAGILAGSVDEVCAFLVDPSERATALRQSTPFAGEISSRDDAPFPA